MNPHGYSSLVAFLAHFEALRRARDAGAIMPADTQTLAALEALIAELPDADRAALATPADADSSASAARHRARAELHLARILAAHGVLVAT